MLKLKSLKCNTFLRFFTEDRDICTCRQTYLKSKRSDDLGWFLIECPSNHEFTLVLGFEITRSIFS